MSEETTEDATPEVTEDVEIKADAETTEEVTEEIKAKAEETAEPEDSSPAKKDGAQKRIDELTKIRREAERERDYWRNIASDKDSQSPPAEKVEPGKTLADFEYDEKEYAGYLTDIAKAEAKADIEKSTARDKAARVQADFSSKEADFSSNLDDYHTVTRNNDLQITDHMLTALQGSDEGPAALYYLGKNPEVADRLSRMNPLDMARELGKIEATKLKVEKAPSITKAPAPTPKISGVDKASAVKANSADSDTLSTEEWMKRRNKQIASR